MSGRHQYYILILLVTGFFIIYSYPVMVSPEVFFFPDEVANFNITKVYSLTGNFYYYEDLNFIAEGIIHPINEIFVNGRLVPAKFLGLPLTYGTIAVTAPAVLRLLTPLLAAIGLVYFFLLLRDIYGSRLALISTIFLGLTPFYWYWSSFTLMENVPALVMFIISLRYFFRLLKTNEPGAYILSGLFLGLALLMRPDYILFAAPVLMITLGRIRRLKLSSAILSLGALVVFLGAFFILNGQLYGSPLVTGQHVKTEISRPFMVSGFSIGNIFANSLNLIDLAPVFFLCGLLGTVYLIRDRGRLSRYVVFTVASLLIFALYYLNDPVIGTKLHSAYGRYLLPALVFFAPFVAYLVYNLKPKPVGLLLMAALVVTNILLVTPVISSNLRSVEDFARMRLDVAVATEPEAVIFLDYWDRAVFPQRRVALVKELPEADRSERLADIAARLSEKMVPLYFLIDGNFETGVSRQDLERGLESRGYRLSETGYARLYRLEPPAAK
ncbi:MAG: glycosyltransferase family 39 protein [Chloroflexi bacterium]|nr:glycosyltransferase family 39 protein [Chloroflexota bacterium]